jgi:hypothetical protein
VNADADRSFLHRSGTGREGLSATIDIASTKSEDVAGAYAGLGRRLLSLLLSKFCGILA